MAQTFSQLLTHIIFSTKGRRPAINIEMRRDLFAYLGGIARELGATALAISGTSDHVHMLVTMRPNTSVAELVRVVKANSPRWAHEKWGKRQAFGWQAGYAAFSVSRSNHAAVARYIQNQERHHRKVTFREEYIAFLKKHGIPYDEHYVFEG